MITRGLEILGIAISKSIRSLRINRVRFLQVENEALVIKRRSLWCWLPIQIGSLVFRFRHPRIEVLTNRRWMDWEAVIQQSYLNQAIEIRGREITQKAISGKPLLELLRNPNHPSQQKLEWLQRGAAELDKLHQTRIEWQGKETALSHGDASVSNLIVDPNTNQARWFDFDLRHDLTVSEGERRADDLRAFAFTSIACCNLEIEMVIAAIGRGYESPQIWNGLLRQISTDQFYWDSFHRSQIERTGRLIRSSVVMRSCVAIMQNFIRRNWPE